LYSITLVGTGYVGLVTGACLADFGNRVVCVDSDAARIARTQNLEIPFYEPGLPDLVRKNVSEGRLSFTSDIAAGLEGAKVVFITVGTPPRRDGSADTRAIFDVAKTVAKVVNGYQLVVQKSTAPVGTAREVMRVLRTHARRGAEFDVASNPEFLREGAAIETFMRPDRVVIGAETKRAADILKKVYDPLFLIETPMVVTTLETAELIKYAANCFLATKISFINEIANLCEGLGADVRVVAKGVGMDRRIGSKFLHAGPGYGGSCFPKDTYALVAMAKKTGEDAGIVAAAIAANERQAARMVEKIHRAVGGRRGARVALLGLAFKPDTDDVREAPALRIIAGLKRRGLKITAFDPVAGDAAARLPAMKDVTLAADPYDAARGADAIAIVTEWNEFRNLNLAQLKQVMRKPAFCDLRNIYDPEEVEAAGLSYVGVGRGRIASASERRRRQRRRTERRGRKS
jgi:UDPglucose 6-dehydrogenase